MSNLERRRHKLCNLLRFGRQQGWIVPINGQIIVAESSPQYFHDRLSKFSDLFRGETLATHQPLKPRPA